MPEKPSISLYALTLGLSGHRARSVSAIIRRSAAALDDPPFGLPAGHDADGGRTGGAIAADVAIVDYAAIDSGVAAPPYSLSIFGPDHLSNWDSSDIDAYRENAAAGRLRSCAISTISRPRRWLSRRRLIRRCRCGNISTRLMERSMDLRRRRRDHGSVRHPRRCRDSISRRPMPASAATQASCVGRRLRRYDPAGRVKTGHYFRRISPRGPAATPDRSSGVAFRPTRRSAVNLGGGIVTRSKQKERIVEYFFS